MIAYLKDVFKRLLKGSVLKIVLALLVFFLYAFICVISFVKVEVDYTSPGTLNSVSKVINIEVDENEESTHSIIYTVSIFSKTKMTIAQYWLACLDKNSEVELHKHEDDTFTVNETYKMNICAKNQSVQDSLITAYTYAKNEGYDVDLIKEYVGVCVCAIPSNYYNIGPESIQIGDIVLMVGDVNISSMDVFREEMEKLYDDYLESKDNNLAVSVPSVKVIRNNEEVTLNACSLVSLANFGYYSKNFEGKRIPETYCYDYYKIDYENSKPKISLENAQTVGPSGGLMQTLYVYDMITGGSISKANRYLVGTGTISTDGSVGSIGALKQKIITARYHLVEEFENFFFIPYDNYHNDGIDYEELLSSKNYEKRLKVVIVQNFGDAIAALKGGN